MAEKLHSARSMPRDFRSDEELSALVRTLADLKAKRAAKKAKGIRGLRLEVLDLEISQVAQEIRRHCVETNLPMPRGAAVGSG
jgi:hypothetical protein